MSVEISVIIPSCQRASKLAACIEALAHQRPDGPEFEVLVGLDGGDRGESAACAEVWRRCGRDPGRLHVVSCAKAGPGPTRNRMLARVSSDLVLFLNDDVRAERDLVAEHVLAHASRRGGPAMVLGDAPWIVQEPDRVFDRLIRERSMIFFYDQMAGPKAADAEHDWGFRHAWTLNLSAPTQALREIRGFNEELHGAAFDDLEMAWRMARRFGAPVLYRPGAIVWHDHRYEPRQYLERERSLGAMAWTLAMASPACARDTFGRDIAAPDELEYAREFVRRERGMVERLEATFLALADVPAAAVPEGPALDALYQQHLPLKRWLWRVGLLQAAQISGAANAA